MGKLTRAELMALRDFFAEVYRMNADDWPNYAAWPIELPAGHWRIIHRHIENAAKIEAARQTPKDQTR